MLLATALAVAPACKRRDETPAPPNTPPETPDGIVVNGSERIGWDQAVPSGSAVQSYSFAALVGGTRNALAGAQCVPQQSEQWACSAPLPPLTPGRHEVRLVALRQVGDAQLESAPSRALVLVRLAAQSPEFSLPEVSNDRRGSGDRASGAGTLHAEVVAASVGPTADIAVARDGTVFVAQLEGAILVRRPGARTWERTDPQSGVDDLRLLSIALDPDFEATRTVYFVTFAQRRDGPVYRIRRARELEGRLGQVAVIGEAPAPEDATAPAVIRFNPDRELIALLPEAGDSNAGPVSEVLRLDRDARALRDRPVSATSDVLPGLASGLTWDASGRRIVQIVRADRSELHLIAEDAPVRLPSAIVWAPHVRPAGIAYYGDAAIPQLKGMLLAAMLDGGLMAVALSAAGESATDATGSLFAGQYGAARAVAVAPDGSIYIGTANGEMGADGTPRRPNVDDVVIRLSRREARRR